MTIYKTTTTVAQWYGKSVTVPSISSNKFVPFASSCMGIAASLLNRKLHSKIRVGLSYQVDTAYADQDKSLVVVSDKFMRGNFSAIGASDSLNAPKTIGAILGIIVHEIGHFAYSPKTLRPQIDYIQRHTAKAFIPELARRVANTVEDIHIEYQISNVAPTLAWTLAEINKLMLTDEKYASSVKNLRSVHSVSNGRVANDILNFILFAKVTKQSGKVSPFVAEIFRMARTATRANTLAKRNALCLALYEILVTETANVAPTTETTETANDESDGTDATDANDDGTDATDGLDDDTDNDTDEWDDDDDDDATDDDTDDLDDDTDNDDTETTDDDTETTETATNGATDDATELDGKETTETTETATDGKFSDEYRDAAQNDSMPIVNESRGERDTPIYDELDTDSLNLPRPSLDGHTVTETIFDLHETGIEMDTRFDKLAQLARSRASVQRAFGTQRDNGRNLRQIHRIVTDRKIFAEQTPTNALKPFEVIIVIDCSGSMTSRNRDGIRKIDAASSAALGAANGLIQARCTVSVYGHTSDKSGTQKTLDIYPLMRVGESVTMLSRRLKFMNTRAYYAFAWNRDGYALYEISKKFQTRDRQKIMIVISDGEPCGNTYDYQHINALTHTKQMVQSIRQNGTKVYSLSIDESAYRANDHIYGKEFNTNSTDANAIDTLIRQLIS